jgi:hypothetical protein
MKCFTTCILMLTLTGCTTPRPIDVVQPGLSQRIAAGDLKVRDQVTIEATDQQTYEFKITSISVASIDGKQGTIPVDQIVSIQKRDTEQKKDLSIGAFDCRRGRPHERLGQRLEGWGCGGSSRQ